MFKNVLIPVTAMVLAAFAAATINADLVIDWWTIDGGGTMFATGGNLELSGTIGQPDASGGPLTGGNLQLVGGFWFSAAESQYGLGDMNCDGAVNAYDIDGFICAVSPACDYEGLYPDCDRMLADCNGDGAVNAYDIDGFITLVGGGG
ncbi:MAG: hypothetical protein ABIG44_13470 [Planctomycetota bacterium]